MIGDFKADPFMLDEDIAGPVEEESRTQKSDSPTILSHTAAPPAPIVEKPPRAQGARKRGRPASANPKSQVTLRLDSDIIAHFRAGGKGWQTRINNALRKAARL